MGFTWRLLTSHNRGDGLPTVRLTVEAVGNRRSQGP